MRPLDRKLGSASPNGFGTSARSWAITFVLIRSAPWNLLLLFRHHHHTRLLPPAMLLRRWVPHGKQVAVFGQDFRLQPDGTLLCPAEQTLLSHEQRREADGSLRVVYGASIRSCRSCPLRERAAVSSPGWSRAAPLAGLEPESAPRHLYATRARPTGRGESTTSVTIS
jgi:hypothetical protein